MEVNPPQPELYNDYEFITRLGVYPNISNTLRSKK